MFVWAVAELLFAVAFFHNGQKSWGCFCLSVSGLAGISYVLGVR